MESKEIFSQLFQGMGQKSKKLVAARIENSIRIVLQRTFVPLLIEIFELRQAIDNLYLKKQDPKNLLCEKMVKTPEEILSRLEEIRENVAETLRWSEGLMLQIEKNLEEIKNL